MTQTKRNYMNGLPALILAGAAFLGGCKSNPAVEDFSALYAGKEDDKYQKEIYKTAGKSTDISERTASNISNFLGCPQEDARKYAEAQRKVYESFLKLEDLQDSSGIGGLLTILIMQDDFTINKFIDLNTEFKENMERLRKAHSNIDSSYANLEETYKRIENKLLGID